MHPLLPVSLGSIFLKQQQQQQQFACLGQRVRGNHDDDDGEKHKNGVLPGNLSPFFWYQRRGGGRYSEEGEGTCALAAFDGCTSLFELLALRLGPSPFWGHHRRAEPSQPPSTETSLLLCASPVYVARHAKKVVATAVAAGKNAMYERHRAASNNDYDDDDGQGTKCIRSVACAYRDVGWNLIRKFFPWSFNLKSSIVVKDLINLLFSITEKIWQWNKKI